MSIASSFAASWHDAGGAQTRTTWGGTICWYPREYSKLVSYDSASGDEHVIRCGFCAGCREFDRRRLADRLETHYAKHEGDLWLLKIATPLAKQAKVRRRISQIITGKCSEGFYRLSATVFALIVRDRKRLNLASRTFDGLIYSWEKIRRKRKRRAWKTLTLGMMEPRETWGEWTNRHYHRGLPIAARQNWSIDTRQGLRKRHPESKSGARAHRNGEFLYPPEAWKPPRLNRRKGPITKRFARTAPGAPLPIAASLASVVAGAVAHLTPKAAPQARLTLNQVAGFPKLPTRTEAVGQFLSTIPQQTGEPSASAIPRKNRSLNLIQGSGYKGSSDLDPEWQATLDRFANLGKPKPP